MSKKKTKSYEIRNLSDGPRDYPLSNGESIYLTGGRKARAVIEEELLSEALRVAEKKGLIEIYEVNDDEEIITNENNGEVID